MDPNFYDNVPGLLWVLLLLVLLLPLAGAAAVAPFGRAPGAARRTAVYVAAGHLIVTAAAGFLNYAFVQPDTQESRQPILVYEPRGVPGDPGNAGAEGTFTHRTSWAILSFAPATVRGAAPADVQFFIGLDGVNLPLVGLTSFMVLLAVMVSWDTVTARPAAYYAWLFLLETFLIGAFVSFDIVLFYVFFELTLVPAFFLIGHWGVGGGRRDAARKFFLYTLLGGLVTLVGIVGVVLTNPTPLNPNTGTVMYWRPDQRTMTPRDAGGAYQMITPGPVTFSIPMLMKNVGMWDVAATEAVEQAERRLAAAGPRPPAELARQLDEARAARERRRTVQAVLFFALMAGFAVKLPLVPFHTWLPAAYAEAPLPVVMVFTALLAKLGAFGMIRVVIPLVPEAAVAYGLPVAGTLGAVGIIYAALCAFAQRDLKMLAAYSSVSHLGFLALGLFALNKEGISGAVLHMVNHGLTAGAMFALLAFLYRRYRTLDMNQYGGLWAKYPVYTFFFVVVCLASVGLPGLNNFVSEMLMLAGLFDPRNVKLAGYAPATAAAVGILLTAWYTMTMLRRVFFGPLHEPAAAGAAPAAPPGDLHGRELWPAVLLAGACLLLGLFPQPLLDTVQPDATRVTAIIDRARLRLDPTATAPPEPAMPEAAARDEEVPEVEPGPDGRPIPVRRPPVGGPPLRPPPGFDPNRPEDRRP